MPVRTILRLGDPFLWQKAPAVIDFSSPELPSLVEDLRLTLADFKNRNGYGRGIAAPQIGISLRVIYIDMPSDFSGPLVNPEIVGEDPRRVELWDQCFSFPELVVKVSRAAAVQVEYSDLGGGKHALAAEGDLSELLQHEIDHLYGILALERAVSPKAIMLRDQWQKLHG